MAFIAPLEATATRDGFEAHGAGASLQVLTSRSRTRERRLVVVHHHRTNAADGRLIGSWCQVCGYLVPAEKRQPGAAPMCTGSKARTGRQHEPARMQALLIN